MSQSDLTAPQSNETVTPDPQAPAGDTHAASGEKLDSIAKPASASGPPPPPKWKDWPQKWRNWHPKVTTDVVNAGCQVVLVVLGVFGYFYTVVPVFNKTELDNQITTLTGEKTQIDSR
jgi:hypothetical protein